MYKPYKSKAFVLTSFLFFIILMGCSSKEDANPYNFPDYVFNGKLPGTLEAYEYAVEAEEGVLEHIPCYCNCQMDPFAHKNVKDCFINSKLSTEDEIVYDKHGYGWGICIEIALDVQEMREKDISLVDIRNYIDKEYSKYAEPTPTPHPTN